MDVRRGLLVWWVACSAPEAPTPLVASEPAAAEVAPPSEQDLLPGPNLALVQGHCTSCHSAALIRQNHMSRIRWDATITWMQETQGLWPLSEDHRGKVLDYLEHTQGAAEAGVDLPWAHPRYEPNPLWD